MQIAALKAAVKKLANLRSTASAGSLTTKSISMCLACNRPIYQSTETKGQNSSTSGAYGLIGWPDANRRCVSCRSPAACTTFSSVTQ